MRDAARRRSPARAPDRPPPERRWAWWSRAAIFLVWMAVAADVAAAQELVTATVFFEDVARRYAAIQDYQANVVLARRRIGRVGDDGAQAGAAWCGSEQREVELSRMEGALSFKDPDLLRIDFTVPAGQVLVSDGAMLTIYMPALDYVIEQRLTTGTPAAASLSPSLAASLLGLRFLRANYGIAYETGPDPVRLGDGSGQQVVRLLLERRVPEEAFETIEVAVGDDRLIRCIVGEYRSGDRVAIEFRAMRTDQSIPDARFRYEPPPDANVYRDLLLGEGD
ncbi:MAG: outer membrane lipoprotein carrier protein LolA [Spirochaetaceae bacterium]|nr:outer membrane lipoprotein carrier protein LolA [Spirochaetaceae bacterium]